MSSSGPSNDRHADVAAQDRDTLLRNYVASRVGQIPVAVGELLDENERLRDALDSLRAAWNGHMDGCPAQGPTVEPPSEADLAAWRDAPSGTASA